MSMDLTDFPFMPLYIARLQKSKAWLRCKRRPELAFYMLNLWMRAWHETPAGSIEDDDDVLADAAMCDPRRWAKIKDDVMLGWERLADGRLHHAVVTELATQAWGSKQDQRQRTEAARQARLLKRSQSLSGDATDDVTVSVTDDVTGSKGEGQGEREGNTDDASASSDRPNAKRATRIPDDWQPDLEDRAFAEQLGLGPILESVIGEFRDYWRGEGGKHARKVSWSLTFRVRCRQLAERRRANGAGRAGPTAAAPDYSTPIPQHRTPKTPPPAC